MLKVEQCVVGQRVRVNTCLGSRLAGMSGIIRRLKNRLPATPHWGGYLVMVVNVDLDAPPPPPEDGAEDDMEWGLDGDSALGLYRFSTLELDPLSAEA